MEKFFNALFSTELMHPLPATVAKIRIPVHDTTAKSLQGCKEKCLEKIKGVIGNFKRKAGKPILLFESKKRLFIMKHTLLKQTSHSQPSI